MLDTLLLFFWAFVSEIAGTIAGFWSSSIFLPIASQILSFHTALLLVAIYHIFWNISRFSFFRKHRNKKIFFLFGLPSIVATVFGAILAGRADPNVLKMILGIVLFLFALYSIFSPIIISTSKPWVNRLGGAASGFTAGLIGTWGVLRGTFMQAFHLPKEQYIATIASIALIVDITRIPIYFWQWFLDKSYLWMIPVLFLIAFVWSRTGKQIVKKLPEVFFRKLILLCVSGMSIVLFYQGLLWL